MPASLPPPSAAALSKMHDVERRDEGRGRMRPPRPSMQRIVFGKIQEVWETALKHPVSRGSFGYSGPKGVISSERHCTNKPHFEAIEPSHRPKVLRDRDRLPCLCGKARRRRKGREGETWDEASGDATSIQSSEYSVNLVSRH